MEEDNKIHYYSLTMELILLLKEVLVIIIVWTIKLLKALLNVTKITQKNTLI